MTAREIIIAGYPWIAGPVKSAVKLSHFRAHFHIPTGHFINVACLGKSCYISTYVTQRYNVSRHVIERYNISTHIIQSEGPYPLRRFAVSRL